MTTGTLASIEPCDEIFGCHWVSLFPDQIIDQPEIYIHADPAETIGLVAWIRLHGGIVTLHTEYINGRPYDTYTYAHPRLDQIRTRFERELVRARLYLSVLQKYCQVSNPREENA